MNIVKESLYKDDLSLRISRERLLKVLRMCKQYHKDTRSKFVCPFSASIYDMLKTESSQELESRIDEVINSMNFPPYDRQFVVDELNNYSANLEEESRKGADVFFDLEREQFRYRTFIRLCKENELGFIIEDQLEIAIGKMNVSNRKSHVVDLIETVLSMYARVGYERQVEKINKSMNDALARRSGIFDIEK